MLIKKTIPILIICIIEIVLGCAPSQTIKTHREFKGLKYDAELFNCKKALVSGYARKDINYPIYLLNYGTIAQYAGELDSARAAFWTVYKINEGEGLDEFTKGTEWLKADQKRVYRVTKRENELLHFYLGINYFLSNMPDKALIEFNKLELIDQNVNKLPIVYFYKAKCYEMLEQYDDAKIEYDKLATPESMENFPWICLILAQLEFLRMNNDDAESYFSKYCDLSQEYYDDHDKKEIIEQNGWYNLIIQIDHQWSRTLGIAKIWADSKYIGNVAPFDYFRVEMTSDEKLRKGMKEAGSYVARNVTKKGAEELADAIMPGFGCLGGFAADKVLGTDKQDKETRFWYYAPFVFSLTFKPISQTTQKIKIDFYDTDGRKIGSVGYDLNGENLYYIGNTVFINPCLDTTFYVY